MTSRLSDPSACSCAVCEERLLIGRLFEYIISASAELNGYAETIPLQTRLLPLSTTNLHVVELERLLVGSQLLADCFFLIRTR